jgi:hypothetical protein
LWLALAAVLILHLRLKRELRTRLRELRHKEAALETEVHDVRAKVQALAGKLEAAAASEPNAMPRVPSGINMSKRIQAIRMLRRGESSAHIAAALGMSRREVDLLIRVHQIGAHRAAQAAGAG